MKEKGNVEMSNIEKKLEALKAEFLGKLEELKKEAEMQKKHEEWKFGEKYFYISQSGRVIQEMFTEHRTDIARKNFGNFFPTKERAEQVAEKMRLLLRLEQLHDMLCPDMSRILEAEKQRIAFIMITVAATGLLKVGMIAIVALMVLISTPSKTLKKQRKS